MALNLSEYNPESTKTTYTGRQLCVWAIDFIKSCLVSRSESERPSFMRYIAGRPELTWNKLSKPKHRLDFSSLDFREHSLDPFFFRFQKLEDKALDELEGYIGLADRYPRYFAEVQKATLIEDDSSSKCQGILCARNYASYTLFMTCKTGFQPSDDLQGYINMQVNEIAGLLAVEGYVIEDGDLEKHLQVWRDSKGSDFLVRLGKLMIKGIQFTTCKLNQLRILE